MKKSALLLIVCSVLISQYCYSQTEPKKNKSKFSQKTLEKGNFERYILILGKNLKDVESKTKEWAEIFAAGEPIDFVMKKAIHGPWTVLKVPKDSLFSTYNYHNLVYWFLGTPPEDQNYAHESIGISIDKNNKSTYVIYNDYDLREKIATNDDVFGVTENNQKFILSIPFETLKMSDNEEIHSFKKFIFITGIDEYKFKKDEFEWTEFRIKIN